MTDALADTLSQTQINPPEVTVPSAQSLPTTLARSYVILGVETDAWVEIFSDRVVVGVSQIDCRVGNYILCQAQKSPVDQKIDFTVTTLLGARENQMLGLYARRITQLLVPYYQESDSIEVLVAISLQREKQDDQTMFTTLVDVLMKQIVEAMKIASKGG